MVSDTSGTPLPGVSVVVKGQNRGTSTDPNGRFNLERTDPEGVLMLTFLGYRNLEIPIQGRTMVNAVMQADIAGLDQVVVVGYGRSEEHTSELQSLMRTSYAVF